MKITIEHELGEREVKAIANTFGKKTCTEADVATWLKGAIDVFLDDLLDALDDYEAAERKKRE